MNPITCPKCKKHMSVFEVACFSCGFIMTDEERDRQLKELEKLREQDSSKGSSTSAGDLIHPWEQKVARKINAISLNIFNKSVGVLIVPIVVIVLLMLAAILFFI